MRSDRSIALEYLDRFKDDIENCLYCIDQEIEPKIYHGVMKEIEAIETTIKIIEELEIE